MNIINLTPHTINIHGAGGIVTVESSGVARVSVSNEVVSTVRVAQPALSGSTGITLSRQTYGAVEGLPEPVEGTLYVVSGLVRAAVPARTDVASPGDLVRNVAGQPIGCRGLVIN